MRRIEIRGFPPILPPAAGQTRLAPHRGCGFPPISQRREKDGARRSVCRFNERAVAFLIDVAGAEHVAQAADLRAHAAQLFFDALVTAVHVVDAIEDGLPICH